MGARRNFCKGGKPKKAPHMDKKGPHMKKRALIRRKKYRKTPPWRKVNFDFPGGASASSCPPPCERPCLNPSLNVCSSLSVFFPHPVVSFFLYITLIRLHPPIIMSHYSSSGVLFCTICLKVLLYPVSFSFPRLSGVFLPSLNQSIFHL